ncbi:MAG: hypothetical protein FWD13_02205 [Treponema sp.]|nr:hypothetical protein [Treponema sp.]
MSFSEQLKIKLEQGLTASKDFCVKAGAKAQDLGERGLLMWDIRQLKNKVKKLKLQLGNETYIAFTDHDQAAINRESEEFKAILDEIQDIKEQIEEKETELKRRRDSD